MTNEEIKRALRERCPITHIDRAHDTAIVYSYAQAWRVAVNTHGEFVSSLELVKNRTVMVVPAEQCEIAQGRSK